MVDAAPPHSSAAVDFDAPCRKCGYNVRGLDTAGLCPECATPIALSVRGDLLRYSDPLWVATIARGLRLMMRSITLYVIFVFILVIVSFSSLRPHGVLMQGILLCIGTVYLIGAWLMTQPDPSGSGEDRYGLSRRLIRAGLIANLASWIVESMVDNAATPTIRLAFEMASFIISAVFLIGFVAQLRYLQALAHRIPEPTFAKRAVRVKWGLGIALAVLYASRLIEHLPAYRATAQRLVVVAAMLTLLLFGLIYMRLLGSMRKSIAREAESARAAWQPAQSDQTKNPAQQPVPGS